MDIELIILAVVAVFVISRLYAVLGQKTGAEPPTRRVREAPAPAQRADDFPAAEDNRPSARPAFTGPAAAGLEAIAKRDPEFDPDTFLRGAKMAYAEIVGAYAEGDKEKLRPMVDDDVYEAYSDAIDQREASGAEPMRLLRTKSAKLVEASLEDGDDMARVGVSFEAELSDGENMRRAREVWTFKRSIESDDPNWLLDEVGIAS